MSKTSDCDENVRTGFIWEQQIVFHASCIKVSIFCSLRLPHAPFLVSRLGLKRGGEQSHISLNRALVP